MKMAIRSRRGKDVHGMLEGDGHHMSPQGEGDGKIDAMSGGSQHDLGTKKLSHSNKAEHEDDTKLGDRAPSPKHLKSNVEHEDDGIDSLHMAEVGGKVKGNVEHEEMEEMHHSDSLHPEGEISNAMMGGMSDGDMERIKAKGPKSLGERAALHAHQSSQMKSALKSSKKPY